jgi:ubiquinone biosynthesis protein
MKSTKGPEATINKTINFSKELLKKVPDLPNVMDRANRALQMLSEGKLNLYVADEKNFELEELKMKNLRNNIVITFLGIVIGLFIVF